MYNQYFFISVQLLEKILEINAFWHFLNIFGKKAQYKKDYPQRALQNRKQNFLLVFLYMIKSITG